VGRIETALRSAFNAAITGASNDNLIAENIDTSAAAPGINWLVLGVTLAALVGAAIAGWVAWHRPPGTDTDRLLQTNLLDPNLPMIPEPPVVEFFGKMLLVVLGLYLFFDRAGAWIHLPGTPVFIGEVMIALGVIAVASMRVPLGTAIRRSPALKGLAAWMGWGALLLVLAISRYGLDAIRDSALWYYGLTAMLITFLLLSNAGRVGRWLDLYRKVMPYALAWFPIAIVLNVLFGGGPMLPFTNVPFTSHKSGNIAVITAIFLAYIWLVDGEARNYSTMQRRMLTSGGSLVLLFSAVQNRGGMVSAAIGLLLAVALMKDRRSEFGLVIGGTIVVVFTLAVVTNVSIPLFGSRTVSAEQLITNVTSTVDPSAGSSRESSTTAWRLDIWGRVLDDIAQDSPIMGFGPGPDIGEIYGIGGLGEETLRNPHNSHVGILARMGFVGIVMWAVLWTVWAIQLLLLRQRLLRQGRNSEAAVPAWLVVAGTVILLNAIFDPTLEGPQVAVWLWAFFGLGAALPLLYSGFESAWLDDLPRKLQDSTTR
jgi:hypothetical protein